MSPTLGSALLVWALKFTIVWSFLQFTRTVTKLIHNSCCTFPLSSEYTTRSSGLNLPWKNSIIASVGMPEPWPRISGEIFSSSLQGYRIKWNAYRWSHHQLSNGSLEFTDLRVTMSRIMATHALGKKADNMLTPPAEMVKTVLCEISLISSRCGNLPPWISTTAISNRRNMAMTSSCWRSRDSHVWQWTRSDVCEE